MIRRSPSGKSSLRSGDAVTYNGRTHYWGKRAGKRRTLTPGPSSPAGFLVPEDYVGSKIFPAPLGGRYEPRHATVWDYVASRTVRVRFLVLQVATDRWVGCTWAKYGDITRDDELCDDARVAPSEEGLLGVLLHDVFADLDRYREKGRRATGVATNVALALLEHLPAAVADAVARPAWLA